MADIANEVAYVNRLEDLRSSTIADKKLVYVESVKDLFFLDDTTYFIDDGRTVIRAWQGNGVYVRLFIGHEFWKRQTVWFVDPSNASGFANDNNTGQDQTVPVLSIEEISDRIQDAAQPITITYLSNPTAAQPNLIISLGSQWNPNLSATQPSVTVNGLETTAALPAGATGVFATSTNIVGNVPPQFTDTGGAGVVFPDRTFIEVLTGASAGARAETMNNEGGGLTSVSVWRNAAGSANATPPAPGDTYRVITKTSFANAHITGPLVFTINNCFFTGWSQANAGQPALPTCVFSRCLLAFATFSPTGGQVTLSSSLLACTVFLIRNNVTYDASGTSYDRKGVAQPMRVTYGGRALFSNGYVQGSAGSFGVAIAAPFSADGNSGGMAAFSIFGIRGVTGSAALQLRKGGTAYVNGTLWGSGNTGLGTEVLENSHMYIHSTVTPTLASTGQELQLDGGATAIPPLVPGAVVPAALALTTYAQWVANFARNVFSLKDNFSGSSISNAA